MDFGNWDIASVTNAINSTVSKTVSFAEKQLDEAIGVTTEETTEAAAPQTVNTAVVAAAAASSIQEAEPAVSPQQQEQEDVKHVSTFQFTKPAPREVKSTFMEEFLSDVEAEIAADTPVATTPQPQPQPQPPSQQQAAEAVTPVKFTLRRPASISTLADSAATPIKADSPNSVVAVSESDTDLSPLPTLPSSDLLTPDGRSKKKKQQLRKPATAATAATDTGNMSRTKSLGSMSARKTTNNSNTQGDRDKQKKLVRLVKILKLQLEKHTLTGQALETKNASVVSQCEKLTRQLQTLEGELVKCKSERNQLRQLRDDAEGVRELVAAKDQQIAAVMKEGESYSNKATRLEHDIRKVRTELTETRALQQATEARRAGLETEIAQLTGVVSSTKTGVKRALEAKNTAEASLEKLQDSLTEKDNTIRQYGGTISRLEKAARADAVRHAKVQDRIAELEETVKGFETDKKQLLDATETQNEEAGSSLLREKTLLSNVQDMQAKLAAKDAERASMEGSLLREIETLKQKCVAADLRNEQLVAAVPEATQPLLRQINALQQSLKDQKNLVTSVETSYDSQSRALKTELAKLRATNKGMKDEITRAQEQAAEQEVTTSMLRERLLKQTKAADTATRASTALKDEVHTLKSKLMLVQTSDKERADASKTAVNALQIELKTQDKLVTELRAELQAEKNKLAEEESRKLSVESLSLEQVVSHNTTTAATTATATQKDTVAATDLADQTSNVTMLRALVRRKDGEVSNLRVQLSRSQKNRDALGERLVVQQKQLTSLTAGMKKAKILKKNAKQMQIRYTAALECIGEKEEELQVLQQEFEMVKDTFRAQLLTLLPEPSPVKRKQKPLVQEEDVKATM